MKKLIIILLAVVLTSCEYNIKTDKQLQSLKSQAANAESEAEMLIKEKELLQKKATMDSLAIAYEFQVYKDSIVFSNLNKVMCYDKNEHRHSCEIYK